MDRPLNKDHPLNNSECRVLLLDFVKAIGDRIHCVEALFDIELPNGGDAAGRLVSSLEGRKLIDFDHFPTWLTNLAAEVRMRGVSNVILGAIRHPDPSIPVYRERSAVVSKLAPLFKVFTYMPEENRAKLLSDTGLHHSLRHCPLAILSRLVFKNIIQRSDDHETIIALFEEAGAPAIAHLFVRLRIFLLTLHPPPPLVRFQGAHRCWVHCK